MQEKKSKSEESSENNSLPGSSSNKMGDESIKLRVKKGDDWDERGSNSSGGRSGSNGGRSGSSGGKASSGHWKGDSSGE